MSLNFEQPVNEETESLIKRTFQDIEIADRKTFLLNKMQQIEAQQMKEIANAAKQPVTVELHSIGDIKVMSDGTRYRVTEKGWEKMPIVSTQTEQGEQEE